MKEILNLLHEGTSKTSKEKKPEAKDYRFWSHLYKCSEKTNPERQKAGQWVPGAEEGNTESQQIDTKYLLGCWKCSKTGLCDVWSGNIQNSGNILKLTELYISIGDFYGNYTPMKLFFKKMNWQKETQAGGGGSQA